MDGNPRQDRCSSKTGARSRQDGFTPGDMDFAALISDAFGADRFTIQNFYRQVFEERRGATSAAAVAKIHETLGTHAAALLPAPGIRGDDGWRLRPEAQAAVHLVRLRLARTMMARRIRAATARTVAGACCGAGR